MLLTKIQLRMDTTDVFDIYSLYDDSSGSGWYKQAAKGDIPTPRIDFCLISVSASDNSSHQIYLYGGRNATMFFDEIYALSVPSFIWTHIFTGNNPRAFHTCHLVGVDKLYGKSQMLTLGGTDSTSFLQGCDVQNKGIGVYNLNSGSWGSFYDATGGGYRVSESIYRIIGGG
ncbi:MAG: hypothetical protein Q9160_006008, partial [Pyrenula sp. 1 TL-2023]